MSAPANTSHKNNANLVKRYKQCKKNFANFVLVVSLMFSWVIYGSHAKAGVRFCSS